MSKLVQMVYISRANIPVASDYFLHQDEGTDDMPAHLKTSPPGCSLNSPILV